MNEAIYSHDMSEAYAQGYEQAMRDMRAERNAKRAIGRARMVLRMVADTRMGVARTNGQNRKVSRKVARENMLRLGDTMREIAMYETEVDATVARMPRMR